MIVDINFVYIDIGVIVFGGLSVVVDDGNSDVCVFCFFDELLYIFVVRKFFVVVGGYVGDIVN